MSSLQGRLLRVLGATIVLGWALALAVLVTYTSASQSSIWDSKLQAIATQLLLMIPSGADLNELGPGLQLRPGTPPRTAASSADNLAFQVWVDRRRLVIRTPGAPEVPLSRDFRDGFSSNSVDGRAWRVYSISDSTGRIEVQVGNLKSVVDQEIRHKALTALVISTVLLILVGALMADAVRRALKPLAAIGAALRRRRKFDLTPLPLLALPAELRPLVESFNHLLGQVDQAVEGERRFIDDAAHELRTPLSALQAQAQVALGATTLAGKDAALVKLLAVVERSSRLSEQLLDLARLDAGAHTPHQAVAELSELIVHVTREYDIQAQRHGRAIVLEAAPARIACDIDEIGILLRNLIDNALRYTEQGGRVRISCGRIGAGRDDRPQVFLEVADDGPGVPEAEREAIFGRFHRVAGNRARGSGIGLSLVAGIAALHRAGIVTGAGLDGRGFSIRLLFPAAP